MSGVSENMSAKLPLIWLLSLLGSGISTPFLSSSRVKLLSLPKHLAPDYEQNLWRLQIIAKHEPFVQLHLLYYYDY